MSAGQQVRFIDIGDGAGAGDVHVAAHQQRADGGARLDRLGLLSLLTEPAPITGMIPAEAKSLANSRMVSSRKPEKTSGVSMGFSRLA